MEELWKPVVGYEGKYEVSSFGRVMSLNYSKQGEPAIRKLSLDKDGYLNVTLYSLGKPKTLKVHRLVAQAFLENKSNLPEINHIDENKSNNHVENLEWCSRSYNISYGQGSIQRALSKCRQVEAVDSSGIRRHLFKSTQEAGRNGFTQSSVAACCRHEQSHHKGFIWRYIDDTR